MKIWGVLVVRLQMFVVSLMRSLSIFRMNGIEKGAYVQCISKFWLNDHVKYLIFLLGQGWC